MFLLIRSVHLHYDPIGSSNSLLCSYRVCLKSFRTRTVKNQNTQVLKKYYCSIITFLLDLYSCLHVHTIFFVPLGRLLFGMLFSSFVIASEIHCGLEMLTFQGNCEFGEEKIVCRGEVR